MSEIHYDPITINDKHAILEHERTAERLKIVTDNKPFTNPLPHKLLPHNSHKTNKKCYTCNPRGLVKDATITKTEHYTFSHDMHKRPFIIVTSNNHYDDIHALPDDSLRTLYKDIAVFCETMNVKGYQVSINCGEWITHKHFHAKLKFDEKHLHSMRNLHYERIKREKDYAENTTKINNNHKYYG